MFAHLVRHKKSRSMSPILAPVSFAMPNRLQAIRESGELMSLPFVFKNASWDGKTADEIRDRLMAVKNKDDAAAFLDFAGYVVMLDAVSASGSTTATRPAYPLKPEQLSDRLMDHISEWQKACRELLLTSYRYPPKEKEPPWGNGPVPIRKYARRGTGLYNEVPITFTWDESGKPVLTLRPKTTLEAAVLSCHLARLADWRFKECRSCGTVFPLLTDHRKIYCDYLCAHREAVRSSRRQAKQAARRSKKEGKR
jgi:hypothetical protein